MSSENQPTALPAASPSQNLREELIVPATKFLRDPKVSTSPLAKKIAFLESKGLTATEIEEAMRRASSSASQVSPPPVPPPNYPINNYGPQVHSWSSRARDLSIVVAVVGGLGYGAYHLFQNYWKTPSNEETELLSSKVDNAMQKLESTLAQMQLLADKRESEMGILREELSALRGESTFSGQMRGQESYALADIQSEIKSLKSLLLNRRQFPPASGPSSVASAPSLSPMDIDTTLANQQQKPFVAGIPDWQKAHLVRVPAVESAIAAVAEIENAEVEASSSSAKLPSLVVNEDENETINAQEESRVV